MPIPNLGRGGLPAYSPSGSTASVANGARTVSFVDGVGSGGAVALQTSDPTTGVTSYVCGFGDFFCVDGVGVAMIASVTDAHDLVLVKPWSDAAQTNVAAASGVIGAGGWYIVRNSVPATGPIAKAIADLQAIGTDTTPDLSRTIDDGTARLKARLSGGQAQIAVGAAGAADSALLPAIQADPATGIVRFPRGLIAPVSGFRNRLYNGGFRIWQRGTSLSNSSGAGGFTADRWGVGASAAVAGTQQQVAAPAGFRGRYALNVATTALPAGAWIDVSQRLESSDLFDLDGVACVLSFDMVGSTSAGSLTGQAIIVANTAPDNGTFSSIIAAIGFTVPVAAGVVSVPIPAANTVGIKNGAQIYVRANQNASAGNANITVGSLQFEKGVAVNDFEYRPAALELAMCQRFCWVFSSGGGNPLIAMGQAYGSGAWFGEICHPVQMRAAPSMTISASTDFNLSTAGGGSTSALSSLIAISANPCNAQLLGSVASGLLAGNSAALFGLGNAKLIFSAEL
jgi:hypothetical protein